MQVEQGVGFLFLLERGDDGVQPAFEDVSEAVEGEVDAVVGDAALRVVVGADAFASVAAADQAFALCRLFVLGFGALDVQEARGK